MCNFDCITKEGIKKNIIQIGYVHPDHPYRILIVGGFRSGKTNTLLNLISHRGDIDKIY